MNKKRLDSIFQHGITLDLETDKTQPGLGAPPIVCGSWCNSGMQSGILTPEGSADLFWQIVTSDTLVLIGQNIQYDVRCLAQHFARLGKDVMPQIIKMYMDHRVYDIGIAQQEDAIAGGHLRKDPRTGKDLKDPITGQNKVGYRLSVIVDLALGRTDAKANDRFRTSYALLRGTPIAQWPYEARTYPVDDSENTHEVALCQLGFVRGPNYVKGSPDWRNSGILWRNLHDHSRQVKADLDLNLGGLQGLRTYLPEVQKKTAEIKKKRSDDLGSWIARGFYQIHTCKCKPSKKDPRVGHKPDNEKCKVGQVMTAPKTGAETKNKSLIKLLLCDAYEAVGYCPNCFEYEDLQRGKIPSPKTGAPINCPRCDGTARDLETGNVPRTKGDGVCADRDSMNESGDDTLIDFATFCETDKINSTYLPWMAANSNGIPSTLWPNVLLTTGRVSYLGCEQTFPRKGGVRETIVPRMGRSMPVYGENYPSRGTLGKSLLKEVIRYERKRWVFIAADYKGLELVCHAQSCLNILGFSDMAVSLNEGKDVHSQLGSVMSGIPYDEFMVRKGQLEKLILDYRQAGKPFNFGLPGGMSAARLTLTQRAQGPDTKSPDGLVTYKGLRFCILVAGAERCGVEKVTKWGRMQLTPTCKACLEVADRMKASWFKTFSENRPYFAWVKAQLEKTGQIVHHVSGRIRGGLDFCSAANTSFQGLGADITKEALSRVTNEQYAVRSSPLYGTRFVIMPHDELILTSPEEQSSGAALRLTELMVGAMRDYCPDMHAAAEADSVIMYRWDKKAEQVWSPDKKILLPYGKPVPKEYHALLHS